MLHYLAQKLYLLEVLRNLRHNDTNIELAAYTWRTKCNITGSLMLGLLLLDLAMLMGRDGRVYTVQCSWFWRGFLHHVYRLRFHPMLDCTSLLEGKNQSTVRLILEARCSSFGYMGWAFKNYYSKFWAFRPLKNSI